MAQSSGGMAWPSSDESSSRSSSSYENWRRFLHRFLVIATGHGMVKATQVIASTYAEALETVAGWEPRRVKRECAGLYECWDGNVKHTVFRLDALPIGRTFNIKGGEQ